MTLLGFCQDQRIRSLFEVVELSEITTAAPFSMISCIDSNYNLEGIKQELVGFHEVAISSNANSITTSTYLDINGSIVINTSDLYSLLKQPGLFSGFDVVWFFRRLPEHRIMVDGVMLDRFVDASTSIFDRYTARASHLDSLERWMKENYCVLGLGDSISVGDGLGMNIYCANDRLAVQLISTYCSNCFCRFEYWNY